MEQLQWHNEKRKVKDLIPWDKNPRKLSADAKKQLETSLGKFNLVEIPAINLDNKIIAGHQRTYLMMLQGKGEEEIDVRVPNRMLTDEEYKEYNLRSNKNHAEFDDILLAELGEDLLSLTGFADEEILAILGEKPKIPESKYTKTIAFSATEEHDIFIRACLEEADMDETLVQYGNRPRMSDKLLHILKEWGKGKGVVLKEE